MHEFLIDHDFRRLFESVPGLYIVLLPDYRIAAVSDAYLSAARIRRVAVVGENFFEVFPDQPREIRASIETAIFTGQTQSTPALPYVRDRGIKHWASTNTPIFSAEGKLTCLIRRVEDMTPHVENETERQSLQQERDLLFRLSVDLLAVVGDDGFFKRVNPAFEKVLGYTEEEMLARPVTDFLHLEDIAETRKRIQTLAGGTPTLASKNRYRRKDGAYRWISWNTTPLGSLFYTVGRDITDQVQQEDIIRHLNEELSRKNGELEVKIEERVSELGRSEAQVLQLQKMDAIGRLAGGIAHDFNNMLGAISLSCDMLAEEAVDPDAVRRHAREIERATDRAAALTRQLLVFSRQQVAKHRPILLNLVIANLESMLTRLIGENIAIVNKFADDLRLTSIDPSQLEQVVLNLVVNARDAMPTGGTITIETRNIHLDAEFTSTHLAVKEGHYVMMSISDDGVGMDAATLAKIFDPFFTTKPVGKGTGLGLSTTYGVIKQNKGTIWVYSEPGQGTVFKIYLPVAEEAMEARTPEALAPELSPGGQTILLVEDDDRLREGFGAMLRKNRYEVLVAANGEEAIALCRHFEGTIHLLLTDMVMPGCTGFALARMALACRPQLRVLYMSGYTNDALEGAGIEDLGALDFLQKPFGTPILLAKVREVLSRKPGEGVLAPREN